MRVCSPDPRSCRYRRPRQNSLREECRCLRRGASLLRRPRWRRGSEGAFRLTSAVPWVRGWRPAESSLRRTTARRQLYSSTSLTSAARTSARHGSISLRRVSWTAWLPRSPSLMICSCQTPSGYYIDRRNKARVDCSRFIVLITTNAGSEPIKAWWIKHQERMAAGKVSAGEDASSMETPKSS